MLKNVVGKNWLHVLWFNSSNSRIQLVCSKLWNIFCGFVCLIELSVLCQIRKTLLKRIVVNSAAEWIRWRSVLSGRVWFYLGTLPLQELFLFFISDHLQSSATLWLSSVMAVRSDTVHRCHSLTTVRLFVCVVYEWFFLHTVSHSFFYEAHLFKAFELIQIIFVVLLNSFVNFSATELTQEEDYFQLCEY